MRCRVQKYDPVPGIEGSQDSSAFDDREPAEVHGLLMRSVCAPMNDGESSREISNRQPTVRFHEPDDFGRCDSVSQELADNSNVDERPADSSASSDFDNVDSTATVRPTANRRASTLQGTIAKQGRLFAQRYQNRLVFKDGTCNIVTKNILERKRRYLVDIFTTFVDMKWRYNLLLFGLAFVGSWFTFALIWWAIAAVNEDYRSLNETDWPVCVANVYDFPTALLFSVETQHTIGYGSRAIETNCPLAVIVLMVQSCYGVFVQSLMTGLIFAKLSRPKRRAQTMMFSKFAVICQRDHQYCLLFRLGDMRRSHIIGTSIRALLVKNRLTREGESIPFCQYSLTVETETNFGDNFVFLVWPVTVVHRIVKGSPLWDLSEEDLFRERFEIIVIFEGIVENTGMTTQFRTSYLPGEILWGHRLEPLVTYCKANGQYDIDFRLFHNTRLIPSMPSCSAREFSERNETVPKDVEQHQPDGDFLADFRASERTKVKKHHIPNGTGLRRLGFRKKFGKKNRVFDVKRVSTDPELAAPADSCQVYDDSNKESKDSTDVSGHEKLLDSNKNRTNIVNHH